VLLLNVVVDALHQPQMNDRKRVGAAGGSRFCVYAVIQVYLIIQNTKQPNDGETGGLLSRLTVKQRKVASTECRINDVVTWGEGERTKKGAGGG
jgi:hypothetical protein